MGDPIYMDTSALVKLVAREDQSADIRQFLNQPSAQVVSSQITEIELLRAIARHDEGLTNLGLEILAQTVLLPMTTSMRLRASYLKPEPLRSLDAIHVATALEIQSDLEYFVTYDKRLLEAASSVGLRVVSPGVSQH